MIRGDVGYNEETGRSDERGLGPFQVPHTECFCHVVHFSIEGSTHVDDQLGLAKPAFHLLPPP